MSTGVAPARLGTGEHVWDLWRVPDVSMRGAVHMWQRDVTLYRRSWRLNVLPNFFEPVLYLVGIGLGLGLYVGDQINGVDYIDYITPGLIAAAAMNGSVFEVTFNVFVKLRFQKLYDAIITTPLEPEDVAAGEIAWGVTRSLIYGTAFLIVTALLGYLNSRWAVLAPVGVLLVGLAFALIGIIFTALVPLIDLFSYFFTLFVTPLFLFSGIFFPYENLPAVVRPIAWCTPLHHGVEFLRALCLTGDLGSAGGHGLWLVVFCAILLPPAINLLRRRLVT
jgi:lipooligosaccharide transport system permease protein